MDKFTYSLPVYDGTTPLETLTGELEAQRYSHACTAAWKSIDEQLSERGFSGLYDPRISTGDLRVELQPRIMEQ